MQMDFITLLPVIGDILIFHTPSSVILNHQGQNKKNKCQWFRKYWTSTVWNYGYVTVHNIRKEENVGLKISTQCRWFWHGPAVTPDFSVWAEQNEKSLPAAVQSLNPVRPWSAARASAPGFVLSGRRRESWLSLQLLEAVVLSHKCRWNSFWTGRNRSWSISESGWF